MAKYCSVSCGVFLFTALAVLAGISTSAHASDMHEGSLHDQTGDLLLFPNFTVSHLNAPVPGLDRNELMPELDIFYSGEHGHLRFLGEFLLNRDEHEMERLQLGWLVQPMYTVWIGRFHTPLGFWNSEHHHGAYLQTSISRPAILNFEDDDGVIPTHVAGLLMEGAVDRVQGSVNYAFGLGKGPDLESGLEAVNILEFRNGGNLSAALRLSYRAFKESAGEFGGFVGYTRIPVVGSMIDEADQTVAGLFYTRKSEKLRLIGELFRVNNRLESTVPTDHTDFTAGYLQAEYQVHANWTLFGRWEDTNGAKNNAYLKLIPEFPIARTVAGARAELGKNQALKLELSRNERQDDTRFNQASLQWSMVFP